MYVCVCVCTFQPRIFVTGCGSEGVKQETSLAVLTGVPLMERIQSPGSSSVQATPPLTTSVTKANTSAGGPSWGC